jgi:hypothetical protein
MLGLVVATAKKKHAINAEFLRICLCSHAVPIPTVASALTTAKDSCSGFTRATLPTNRLLTPIPCNISGYVVLAVGSTPSNTAKSAAFLLRAALSEALKGTGTASSLRPDCGVSGTGQIWQLGPDLKKKTAALP